jgi:plastocyanin
LLFGKIELSKFFRTSFMKTTKKVGIVLATIVLGLVISPAIPFSEAGETRRVTASMENFSTSSTIKTVMIVGHEDSQFVPHTVHLKIGDSIRFINQDGQDGGLAHDVISVDESGMPNGKFNGIVLNVGDTYTEKFTESGIYNYIDSTYPQMQGIIVVS